MNKYVSLAKRCIRLGQYETALKAISTQAYLLYMRNQKYSDMELEELLWQISSEVIDVDKSYVPNDNTVLFYDAFANDIRVWGISYLKAIAHEGFHLIYVTMDKAIGKNPHVLAELSGYDVDIVYLSPNGSYLKWAKDLNDAFERYKPRKAFFYSTPWDVSGICVFNRYTGIITRFLIDLTNHAFWLGLNTSDYFIESRHMGASIAVYERGISAEKVIRLDCAPYINPDKPSDPFPFDIYNKRYVFSGGNLYKTLGDGELNYYKMVKHILKADSDIYFLYAGGGDGKELIKLSEEYPGRVFWISERPDFFEIMKNSVFFLNTYPMFGGLMMRYSALAGKVPVTLRHEDDGSGILINQAELGIEFDTLEEVCDEIDHLLDDDEYRMAKEKRLKDVVIDEETFAKNVSEIINNDRSFFSFESIVPEDTSKFREEYLKRWGPEIESRILNYRENRRLVFFFPISFIRGIPKILKDKRKRRFQGK